MRKTFSFPIFVHCVSNVVVISICTYQLSIRQTMDSIFLKNLLYCSCTIGQFFIYCWFGTVLTTKVVSELKRQPSITNVRN